MTTVLNVVGESLLVQEKTPLSVATHEELEELRTIIGGMQISYLKAHPGEHKQNDKNFAAASKLMCHHSLGAPEVKLLKEIAGLSDD